MNIDSRNRFTAFHISIHACCECLGIVPQLLMILNENLIHVLLYMIFYISYFLMQLFSDLYLGNSPNVVSDQQGRQPKVLRRQLSNPSAVRQRRRENEVRRRRSNEFGLEGTAAYSNLTLRDIIH